MAVRSGVALITCVGPGTSVRVGSAVGNGARVLLGGGVSVALGVAITMGVLLPGPGVWLGKAVSVELGVKVWVAVGAVLLAVGVAVGGVSQLSAIGGLPVPNKVRSIM